MTKDARVTPALRTRLTAAASGALLLLALGAAVPATARTAVDHSLAGLQVEEVISSEPVMVSDLEAAPAGVTATRFCAVLDGTYGCQPGYDNEDGLVVAELYQHADQNADQAGWRFVVFNPRYRFGCTSSNGGDHEGGANLDAYQNAASSVQAFNRCAIKLYDREGWNGDSTGWIFRDDNLGTGIFNDRADSFAIS
ncbi:hypothetical protein [Promicromonospora sp. NPDC060271]|uniref:hypothetical protein n=1 Tax=Promicromonospora sp. NPDC060271 TaxID=3347089 RepID=UPI0036489D25